MSNLSIGTEIKVHVDFTTEVEPPTPLDLDISSPYQTSELSPGICYECGQECNPCSQKCGPCFQEFWWMQQVVNEESNSSNNMDTLALENEKGNAHLSEKEPDPNFIKNDRANSYIANKDQSES
jgi:hypothetical protein